MKNERVSWRRVISFAGAFIAFQIGSGFATGQEILQYFASYGLKGICGALLAMGLMTWASVSFMKAGKRHQPGENGIFQRYLGETAGMFFDFFSVLFLYLSYWVMEAGAGAAMAQHYGMPECYGSIFMAVLSVVTVLLGLSGIVEVLGKIGPVIAGAVIFIGLAVVLRDPSAIWEGDRMLSCLEVNRASFHWAAAAAAYAGYSVLGMAVFLSAMGASAESEREAALGGGLGAVCFCGAVVIMAMGLLSRIDQVARLQIPMLSLAASVHPALPGFFTLIIMAGIYTTAVPLLWSVTARFAPDKSPRFKILALILATAGTAAGVHIPFAHLVSSVYLINGYLGLLFLFLVFGISLHRKYFPLKKM